MQGTVMALQDNSADYLALYISSLPALQTTVPIARTPTGTQTIL